jgi:hypothetical protein
MRRLQKLLSERKRLQQEEIENIKRQIENLAGLIKIIERKP